MHCTRRQAIKSGAVVGAVALAGCTGGGDNGDAGGDGDGNGDGSGSNSNNDGGSNNGSGLKSLNVANIEGATFAPFMISKEQGLFEEHGVSVESRTFVNPSDMYKAVQLGELDFAYATSPFPVARAYNSGQDVSLLKPDMESHFFMTGKTKYESIEDLEGQKVGNLPPGSSTHFGWSVAIEEMFGEEFTDFLNVVGMGPGSMATSVQQGDLEAATLWPPFTVEMTAKDKFHIIEPLKSTYEEATGHSPRFAVGAAKDSYLSENRDAISSFYDAIEEAAGMIAEDPSIMVDVGYIDVFGLESDAEIEILKERLSGMYPTDYDREAFRSDLAFQYQKGVELGQIDTAPGEDIYEFI
jgi:ABC-type nitrate/sulfonate/bicarbonate transport system substrate-binding protein